MAYCEHCGSPLAAPEGTSPPSTAVDTSAADAIANAQAVLDQIGGDAEQTPADTHASSADAPVTEDAVSPAATNPAAIGSPAVLDAAGPAESQAPGIQGSVPDLAVPVAAAQSLTITFSDGAQFTVQDDVTNVGRSDIAQNWHPELDVIPFGGGAPDFGVSRHQAVIQRHNGSFSILDVGSTNGTFVNGHALEYNKAIELHDGDSIAFGAFNGKVQIG
jgi:hypothetical protein